MSFKEEKKICSKNQLEITTIDQKQLTVKEDKYQCIKFLIEKIYSNMVLVDQTEIMIKEMKNQIIKIKENQKRIENIKQIECLIKQFKGQIKYVKDNILINIHSRIQTIKKDFEEYDSNSKIYKFEDEGDFYQKLQRYFNFEISFGIRQIR
ncbi:unnamed protein product [Paramecium pentaurelia]|uniref:Uncharacterized protein n=1 Tax=Paramecium pentaurelia TaxID=43138 RepID=A0A8S1WVZ6_9CILI|nr:unnamed protein product [Paramecium pentaurelia]